MRRGGRGLSPVWRGQSPVWLEPPPVEPKLAAVRTIKWHQEKTAPLKSFACGFLLDTISEGKRPPVLASQHGNVITGDKSVNHPHRRPCAPSTPRLRRGH